MTSVPLAGGPVPGGQEGSPSAVSPPELAPIPGGPSCASCEGRCCRHYQVPVQGYDVWRISRRQRLGPEEFVRAVHMTEDREDVFYLGDKDRLYLVLDKQGKFHRYQPCIFLVELPGAVGRCGIYEHRPNACRVYPMKLEYGRVFLQDAALCPPEEWPQEAVNRPAWRKALKRSYLDYDIYCEVTARWNARVATYTSVDPAITFSLLEYLSYLMNVYDALNELENEVGAEEMARLETHWPEPPRALVTLDEMRLCRGDIPWLDYLVRAREIIDRAYPEVLPLPIRLPIASE